MTGNGSTAENGNTTPARPPSMLKRPNVHAISKTPRVQDFGPAPFLLIKSCKCFSNHFPEVLVVAVVVFW